MREGSRIFKGTIAVSQVEGRHYELVADTDGQGGIYVLIPADDEVGRVLAASVGKRVCLVGFPQAGVSIFMSGTLLRVTAVRNLSGRER